MHIPKKFLFVAMLLVCLSVSCDKENYQVVPYVPVSFSINLNVYNELNIPGNSAFIQGYGYAGILIYCEMPGTYYAYDAACTNEISTTCRVVNDAVLGTCSCCKSQFILMGGGYPSKGPASKPLQQYNTSVMNNMLRVYN